MTADQFRAAIKSLGIRQRWLADRLGVETSTVSRWATGHFPVPQYVEFCLFLMGRLAARNARFPGDF